MEPHALAPAERHWYLLCWDLERDDWRTFRVDRLSDVEHTRVLFTPRPLTPEQIDEFIAVARSWSPQAIAGAAVMDLGLDDMRAYFGQWGQGAEAVDAGRTSWPVGGSDFREVMYTLAWIPSGVPYTVELPDSAREELREALVRMLAALDSSGA